MMDMMDKNDLIVTSWQVNCDLGGPATFQIELVLPFSGMNWSMDSNVELARTVYEFFYDRTLPRWRRVWNALRGI